MRIHAGSPSGATAVAKVLIILVGGEVEWVTDGDVDVELLDYDNGDHQQKITAGIQRLAKDLCGKAGDRWTGIGFPGS
jgi:hypothetical protein